MMKCMLVDDEPLALDLMETFVKKVPFLQLVNKSLSATDALLTLKREKIDLLFLDIRMPDISGIQLLKSLQHPPMVIFTTAYENYALEGYDLDVIDYLMKPIPFDRFLKAVNKAYEYFTLKNNADTESGSAIISAAEKDYIFVKANYQSVKIEFDEIKYIEGLKDYVKIYITERPIITLSNLKNFELKLPLDKFVRAHKSYIVQISKIDSMKKNSIVVAGKEITIGARYRENFEHCIKKHSENKK
jgi:DNA-binding LytR/AlgR family response regulator